MKILPASLLLSTLLMHPGVFAADTDAAMQEQMQKMTELMAAMRAEQDPAKLAELRQQHREAMREGMRMMESSDTARPGPGQGQGPGPGMGMAMEGRMAMMEQQMEMMQHMMGQMMQHEAEESERPVHQHRP